MHLQESLDFEPKPHWDLGPAEDDKAWRMLQLLTSKPALYVSNVDEGQAALLPVDSDRSARHIRDALRARLQSGTAAEVGRLGEELEAAARRTRSPAMSRGSTPRCGRSPAEC